VACKRITLFFFLLYGTWKFNIYCTGFWEKCANGHADVSEKIYATIMLLRHVQWKVSKLFRNVDVFYHFGMYRNMRKVWKWSSPTFWGKIYAAITLFRHVQLKVTKLSRNVDIIYYFVTVQVCAKSVNMVTATFRSKFLQQSSSSVTTKK
jgi:hypothetical protein